MSVELVIDWVINTGIDVSILVLLVLLVRRPFTKIFGARTAYALWSLPFLRLILPELSLNVNLPSWLHNPTPVQPNLTERSFEVSGVVTETVAAPINWQMPVLAIWIAGAILWLGAQWLRQRNTVSEITNSCDVAPRSLTIVAGSVAAELGLRRSPGLLVSRANTGPLVTGLFRPLIVLPQNFESEFTPPQQRMALFHELAHIKRKDLWAAFAMLLFRALNWPNPLVHYSARRFRVDQEAACDAFVLSRIGDTKSATKSYAETLVQSAKLTRISPRDAQAITPLCLTIHHPLKERLMTMKNQKNQTTLLSRLGVGAFLIAALTATAPLTIATAQETQPTSEMTSRKVIKMATENDGVREEKHYEMTSENGVETVYSIDQHGNRTVVDPSEIESIDVFGETDINVWTDGEDGQNVKIIGGDGMPDGAHGKIVVKRMAKDGQGSNSSQIYSFTTNEDVDFDVEGSTQASTMVRVAKDLIARAGEDDAELSANARRKLDKARKALEEAEKALANE